MEYKVKFSPESVEDIESIVGYIAVDNPQKAESYGNELIDRALGAEAMPRK